MLPEIESRFASLESRRQSMVERVRTLKPGARTARPKSGEFSPVEVLMHMALAEKFDLMQLEKSTPESFRGRTAKPSFIFPNAVKRICEEKKMGTFKSMTPLSGVTLESASHDWEQVRASLRSYFDRVTDLDSPMIKLFIFGRLSALDFLNLLEAHCKYHEIRFPT